MRYLINKDGTPFEKSKIQTLSDELNTLDDDKRRDYRDKNADEIAKYNETSKFLIVSGPGTGKSHLFLSRINYWYQQNAQAKVLVTSFVRKLVADLQNDIDGDDQLTHDQKK